MGRRERSSHAFQSKFKEADCPETEELNDSQTRIVEELINGITEKTDT